MKIQSEPSKKDYENEEEKTNYLLAFVFLQIMYQMQKNQIL